MVIIFDLAKEVTVLRARGVLLICRFLPVRYCRMIIVDLDLQLEVTGFVGLTPVATST